MAINNHLLTLKPRHYVNFKNNPKARLSNLFSGKQESSTLKQRVNVDDIAWSYRNLLGREPESEDTIRQHLMTTDFRQLVLNFVECPEFLTRKPGTYLSEGDASLPPFLEKMSMDFEATDVELAQCAEKIKKAWEFLGEERAHRSVLTYEAFHPENLKDSIDSFWASGEAEARATVRMLAQNGFSACREAVCVEYGCGVGRVMVNFAEHFNTVHGYDISRNHLHHARARADELGRKNITFHECASDVLAAIVPCDFFYSLIVLQHNPPPVIVALLRRALSALKPNGIAVFQLPTYIVGYRFSLREWLQADHALDMQMHCVPQEVVMAIIAEANCRVISVREDGWAGAPGRMISNTFVCRKQP